MRYPAWALVLDTLLIPRVDGEHDSVGVPDRAGFLFRSMPPDDFCISGIASLEKYSDTELLIDSHGGHRAMKRTGLTHRIPNRVLIGGGGLALVLAVCGLASFLSIQL